MKKQMLRIVLIVGCNIGWLMITDCLSSTPLSITYHLVVDSATFRKAPRDYELVEYDPKGAKLQVYVKKTSARQIPAGQIESVTVRKERIFGNSADDKKALEQMIREKSAMNSKERTGVQIYPKGFFFSITFKLTPAEWKREMEFVSKHLGERFRVKVGTQEFGLAEFVEPLQLESTMTRESIFYTGENDPSVIKKMLAGFHEVIWK